MKKMTPVKGIQSDGRSLTSFSGQGSPLRYWYFNRDLSEITVPNHTDIWGKSAFYEEDQVGVTE